MVRRLGLLLLPVLLASCGSAASPAGQMTANRKVVTTGLDGATMARTVVTASVLPRLRSLLVLRDSRTLSEHRFNGGPPLDRPVNIKSASKSVMSALVRQR